MAKPVADADTVLLIDFDESSVPGTGYATLVDSIASGGTARNLTETNGGAGARSPNYSHIVNAGGVAGRRARWYPGKSAGNAAFHSRAGDAASAAVFTGSYTVRGWLRPDLLASEVLAYTGPSESTADNCLFQMTILGTGLLQLFWEFAGGTNVNVTQTTGTGLAAGVWRYFAITVDNSGATSTTKFYVGTSSTPQQTVTGSTKATGGTTATWFVGCSGPSPASGYLGAITGLVVDSVVRSGAEIAAFAALGTSVPTTTDGSSFVAYHCQEMPDAFSKDPYGNHLRKVGAGAITIVPSIIPGDLAGKARYLDGTVEYIGHWGNEALRQVLIGNNSLEVWFKGDTGWDSALSGLATYGDWTTETQADNAWSWEFPTDRRLRLSYEQGAGTDVTISTPSPYFTSSADGQVATFVSIVKRSSGGSSQTVDFYRDPDLVASVTGTPNFDGATTDYFRLGVGSGASGGRMKGTLDGIHLRKRALVALDIGVDFRLAPPVATLVSEVGDIGLAWEGDTADMFIANDDVGSDRGLRTAVLLSLFTDRRAQPDDQIPAGDGDRRGFWADQFAEVEGDLMGSRLWLLDRSAQRRDVAQRVPEYVREALAWMLQDRVVSSIDVIVEETRERLLWQVTITRPTGDPLTMRFAHAWDGEVAR